jgi:hypothetical protein
VEGQGIHDVRLHTRLCIESVTQAVPGAGVLPVLVTGIVIEVINDCHCVTERVDITH